MRHLRLATDYYASPVWDVDAGGMVELSTLPIDADMVARLRAWADRYDATLNQQDPTASSFASPADEAAFLAEGSALARALQEQLGDEYVVQYHAGA